jgi:hypothetical protein
MAFSYSGLTNFGKVTLPSVEGWGTSMNIIRDPPKSITTRRKDKVGDTSEINQMIEESGDRVCEMINVYARGVNPSVAVSYSNVGSAHGRRTQSRLPHPIMKDGAFRPPIRRQEDLLPLSRLPRTSTSVSINPGCKQNNKKIFDPDNFKKSRLIVSNPLSTTIRPTAVYPINKPSVKPFEVKYVIQPTINVSAKSGVKNIGISNTKVMKPSRGINDNIRHNPVYSTKNNKIYIHNNDLNFKPYVHNEIKNISTTSNVSSSNMTTQLSDILDMSTVSVQDVNNIEYNTTKTKSAGVTYIHDEIHLNRNLPEHDVTTNKGQNTSYKRNEYDNELVLSRNTPLTELSVNPVDYRNNSNNSSQSYNRLPSKIQPGGYNPRANVPMTERIQKIPEQYETEKSKLNKSVSKEFSQRFSRPFPL